MVFHITVCLKKIAKKFRIPHEAYDFHSALIFKLKCQCLGSLCSRTLSSWKLECYSVVDTETTKTKVISLIFVYDLK